MNWFLVALIPPALWSVTNHLDKYLISKYFKGGGVGALMVFSSLIGVLLLPFIAIFNPGVFGVNLMNAILIALNGFIYILAVLPYFYAIQRDEASVTVPLFQLIPIFSYILAYFVLKETLLPKQIIGGILVVMGAIGISLEIGEEKTIKFKKEVFWLMALSSLLFATNFLFFKFFALQESFWTTSFWEYVGLAVFAILVMVFIKPYRREFFSVMKKNKLPVIGLNGFNEIINIIAKLSFNFASLLTPITITWVVDGFQPFFVFVYGVILTLFFPHLGSESLAKRHLAQKIIAIAVMFVGTYFLNV